MTLPDYLILLTLGGFILLAVWRVLIPIGRGMVESWREMRRADRLHREHMEFRKRKQKERF